MILFKDRKEPGKTPPRIILKDRDMALIICSFSAVFGILNFKFTVEAIAVTPLYLILSLVFVCFWLGLAFSAGRRLSKGFIVPACIIWGITLLYLLFNYLTYVGLKLNTGSVFNSIISFFAAVMLLVSIAAVSPLVPGLAALGFFPSSSSYAENAALQEAAALTLLLVCFAFMVLIAASFFAGRIYETRFFRAKLQKNTVKPREIPDIKDYK